MSPAGAILNIGLFICYLIASLSIIGYNIYFIILFPLFLVFLSIFRSVVNKKNEFKAVFKENKKVLITNFIIISIIDLLTILAYQYFNAYFGGKI